MKTYKLNQNTNKIIPGLIIFILCSMYISFKQTGHMSLSLIAPIIVLILRYFWQKSHKALIINTTHLEFNTAPLQSKRLIKYNELQDAHFDPKKKKIVFITKVSKKIKLSLKEFHKNDRQTIVNEIFKKIPK
ncbi:hypothetical protein Q4517_05610 [Tenacibaculum sp. 1_MG-2023]|uniref:hypothetical protein n=1 Tax=Tenacibaculum sp. 1_MG-2023 TaxID=3062653 RepID=UPI0026E43734|nr:hypothetical protein [Tenacibaculum sp. 1_MG-2023]MDO6675020.1 hypothetical protein [Tenacibaculum sp. 1_MG-2023]